MAAQLYQKMVNKYIDKLDPDHIKSRPLHKGEFHIPLHNFSGPGTRMDLKEVRDMKPYNNIDACSKIHDEEYESIKELPLSQRPTAVIESDKKAVECYDKFPSEYGHDLAKTAIKGKITLESLLSLLHGQNKILYGGLVHNFTDDSLYKSRLEDQYTDDEKYLIDLLRVNQNSIMVPIGSFTYSIQKYPSDIDINETVTVTDINSFVNDFKELISKIISWNDDNKDEQKRIYFSDFKAGFKDSEQIHWSACDILKGKFDGVSLSKALQEKSVIKLDILIVEPERIIEASNFFILVNPDGSYINLDDDYFKVYLQNLKSDIKKYSVEKPFKSVKRLWSLSRVTRDTETLKKLAPLIDSNISLLSQISSDVESTMLLLEKYGIEIFDDEVTKRNILSIFNKFKKKIAGIVDIYINPAIYELIDAIIHEVTYDVLSEELLTILHRYLMDIVKDETVQYLKVNNIAI